MPAFSAAINSRVPPRSSVWSRLMLVIYMLLGEVFEGQGGGELEEGRMKGLEEGALLLHEVYHILLADAHTVHTDALPEVHQVGRGVKAYLEALGLKDGGQTV